MASSNYSLGFFKPYDSWFRLNLSWCDSPSCPSTKQEPPPPPPCKKPRLQPSSCLSTEQEPPSPPPCKKPRLQPSEPEPVEFILQFRVQNISKFMVRPSNEPSFMAQSTTHPIRSKSFPADACYFKFQIMSHAIVLCMLSELGIKEDVITSHVSSYARQIANNLSNMGGKKVLRMWIDLVQTDFFLYDERGARDEIIRESMAENERRRGYNTVPALKSAVDMLEKVRFDGGDSMKQCTICLKEFKVGVDVTRMPCKHCFHGHCIGTWLNKSHECPLCRFKMPSSDSLAP